MDSTKAPSQSLEKVLHQGMQLLGVEFDQKQKLLSYLDMLIKWNHVYNLTSVREPVQMVTHHLLDSLALVRHLATAKNVLDVGAGGGLPGVVLAIWACKAAPVMSVSMVDSTNKKAAFLKQVKMQLGLGNVSVYSNRVQELLVAQKFDVITSRAFAGLADFISWSQHLLSDKGQFIALKGAIPNLEIKCLPSSWEVAEIRPLTVPFLNAKRHLIFIKRK
jgi:16S rRNA (guanine527-N7)-methyltransferase